MNLFSIQKLSVVLFSLHQTKFVQKFTILLIIFLTTSLRRRAVNVFFLGQGGRVCDIKPQRIQLQVHTVDINKFILNRIFIIIYNNISHRLLQFTTMIWAD